LLRCDAGGNRLRVAAQADRLRLRGAESVLSADGKSVHVRAVEAGNVDLGADVGGEHPAQCLLQGYLLARQGLHRDPLAPTALGFVPIQDLEELPLSHGVTSS
jgi:hypothetical protein